MSDNKMIQDIIKVITTLSVKNKTIESIKKSKNAVVGYYIILFQVFFIQKSFFTKQSFG